MLALACAAICITNEELFRVSELEFRFRATHMPDYGHHCPAYYDPKLYCLKRARHSDHEAITS